MPTSIHAILKSGLLMKLTDADSFCLEFGALGKLMKGDPTTHSYTAPVVSFTDLHFKWKQFPLIGFSTVM